MIFFKDLITVILLIVQSIDIQEIAKNFNFAVLISKAFFEQKLKSYTDIYDKSISYSIKKKTTPCLF